MPDDADGDGWSIHVPTTGFQTAEVEGGDDAEAPSVLRLRAAMRDAEAQASGSR